jgi:hypothetical protein
VGGFKNKKTPFFWAHFYTSKFISYSGISLARTTNRFVFASGKLQVVRVRIFEFGASSITDTSVELTTKNTSTYI